MLVEASAYENSYVVTTKRVNIMRKIVQSSAVRQRVVEKAVKRMQVEKSSNLLTNEVQLQAVGTDNATDEEKFLTDFG